MFVVVVLAAIVAGPEGKFYCTNIGDLPRILFSSFVNDNISGMLLILQTIISLNHAFPLLVCT